MKTVGLITEYNPFHKGHKYHIEESKRITGADHVVVIMSGNFVQRGEPAIFDKYLRAHIALESGADLILELPVLYATASAELFAYGAVSLLHKLGIIDCICFGSEHATIEELQILADILTEEPENYRLLLQRFLKKGMSYPAARAQAVTEFLKENCCACPLSVDSVNTILNTPNHILGIEYLKALRRCHSHITPYVIRRIYANYHDTEPDKCFYSASALRSIEEHCFFSDSLSQISPLYTEYLNTLGAVTANDFSLILGEKLLCATETSLNSYTDISSDFAHSILTHRQSYQDFCSFITLLKNKSLTYTRISRSLMHIMLGITNELQDHICASDGPSYIRVLGFNSRGRQLLGRISPEMSLLTRMADSEKHLHTLADHALFKTGLYADNLYRMVQMNKYHTEIPNEFTRRLLTL